MIALNNVFNIETKMFGDKCGAQDVQDGDDGDDIHLNLINNNDSDDEEEEFTRWFVWGLL